MRQKIETVSCDLCGYGGPLTRPEDFTHYANGVDLCHWCAAPGGNGVTECGQHRATITADGWTCDCGAARTANFLRLAVRQDVLEVIPNVVHASAVHHVQN